MAGGGIARGGGGERRPPGENLLECGPIPMARTKTQVIQWLVEHHFQIEDGLERVVVIHGPGFADPREPIKLLEVNANTIATGSVEPFSFSPTSDVPFVTEIAEITPEEYTKLQKRELAMPEGWPLEDAEDRRRPAA
jgi:hypothetical protein